MASRRPKQSELAFPIWGGRRPGAGRKPAGARPRVSHAAKPKHDGRHPVHVTVRLREGLPTLRADPVLDILLEVFVASSSAGFRVVHASLQASHLHLLVEARDGPALSRGMQGLLVRAARALNRLWRRRGALVGDHFHARALATPREVRNALVYVLQNARGHGAIRAGVDRYSTGRWFDGWRDAAAGERAPPRGELGRPRTWLLREGWRRHGPIATSEVPAPARSRRSDRLAHAGSERPRPVKRADRSLPLRR